jgi:hypothetical protein
VGTDVPGTSTPLPAQALELLEEAESRLREGDWAGFGEALERLRTLLRRASGGGGASVDPPDAAR